MDIGNRCVNCGRDTSFGSGLFVNRIPADADYESDINDDRTVSKQLRPVQRRPVLVEPPARDPDIKFGLTFFAQRSATRLERRVRPLNDALHSLSSIDSAHVFEPTYFLCLGTVSTWPCFARDADVATASLLPKFRSAFAAYSEHSPKVRPFRSFI